MGETIFTTVMVFLETPLTPPGGANEEVYGDMAWGDGESAWAPTPLP
jgi:hypothetical protein